MPSEEDNSSKIQEESSSMIRVESKVYSVDEDPWNNYDSIL